jgi:hypothetical protein
LTPKQGVQKLYEWDANKIKDLMETPFFRGDTPGTQTFSPDLLLRVPQHSHHVLLRLAEVTAGA